MPLNFAHPLSPEELRRKLDNAGYDLPQIDVLGAALKIDLVAILAGWAPVLARLADDLPPSLAPPPLLRLPWYRRFAHWIERNWYA